MSKKKVLIIIEDMSSKGGTERVASFLYSWLNREQYDVSLLSKKKERKDYSYGLKESDVDLLKENSLSELAKYIKSCKPDVIIPISMGRLTFQMTVLRILHCFRFKVIASEHVGFCNSSLTKRFVKLLSYNFCNRLVLLTERDRRIIDRFIYTKAEVIPNSTSFEMADEGILEKKTNRIIMVGRLTYQKNIARAIKIWSDISRDNWSLQIIGDGEDLSNLKDLANQLGVSDSVEFKPFSENIDNYYREASCLILTSRYEGLPLVLIESKFFATPSIAFDCVTGPRELIQSNDEGFLIDYHDDGGFGHALTIFINSEHLRRELQLGALRSSERYSKGYVIERWHSAIQETLS
ncbi:hypothetical protein C9980_20350 [Vibrio mediterranei]|uniref:glycosyltransferase n=1 Tax=Vibrio mediterranei TaxID=689 RepID=UPI000D186E22|nr:glycosyltransferase [Vibrio mediterranei]PTC02970.1 hypothetical protein C9980_20350 [Vibrio mediterranei]